MCSLTTVTVIRERMAEDEGAEEGHFDCITHSRREVKLLRLCSFISPICHQKTSAIAKGQAASWASKSVPSLQSAQSDVSSEWKECFTCALLLRPIHYLINRAWSRQHWGRRAKEGTNYVESACLPTFALPKTPSTTNGPICRCKQKVAKRNEQNRLLPLIVNRTKNVCSRQCLHNTQAVLPEFADR